MTESAESSGTDDVRPASVPGPNRSHSAFDVIDRASLWVEKPVRRLSGSNRLNPLPYAGTISVFLLMVVVASGFYITLFFEFGREASYNSVVSMEGNALQRVMRALHRYSSAAMVLTTVVHGWRIFAAKRFTGQPRRWRWASGFTSLFLVWFAGVTGYWLIWDRRVQAINEILISLLGSVGWGSDLTVNDLSGVGEGSGSGLLLIIWFVHLGLTAIIVWFMYRHLRGSKLKWLPPQHWMLLMGGSLLLVSMAVPVGMLGPARAEELVGEIPLDPFVLFLLPPLLSDARWLVILGGAAIALLATVLPWLIERHQAPIIEIIDDACTGCELCVIDCPYDALTMIRRPGQGAETMAALEVQTAETAPVERLASDLLSEDDDSSGSSGPGSQESGSGELLEPDGTRSRRISEQIAEVDPSACVSCGICVASCAFGAIELPGLLSRQPDNVAGRHVVVACDRHLASSDLENDKSDKNTVVVGVRCAGALSPAGVRGFLDDGAIDVQLIGCPPNDCRYGIGNTLASERFSGDRAPRLPRRWIGSVTQDWVAPTELGKAIREPGNHPEAKTGALPKKREALLGAGLLIVVSVLATAFATRAPFSPDVEVSGVRIIVDHSEGHPIVIPGDGGSEEEGVVSETLGLVSHIELSVAGHQGEDRVVPRESDRSIGVIDWELEPGSTDLEIAIVTDEGRTVIHSGATDLVAGERLVVRVGDVPRAPGVKEGESVFTSRAAGCTVCHSIKAGDDGVGPSLYGVASAAGERVPGLDAELYLRQSILLPDQYVLDGWPSGQMLPIYQDSLTESELQDLIVYLLSLEDSSDTDSNNSGDGDS